VSNPARQDGSPSETTFDGVVVTFARREESGALIRKLSAVRRCKWGKLAVAIGTLDVHSVAVVHTGIGPVAAKAAAQTILEHARPHLWIGAGFAGALDPSLQVGDVVSQGDFEHDTKSKKPGIISHALPVETANAKAILFPKTEASAVDMETTTLAAAAKAAGIHFQAIRAISDIATDDLPVPFKKWFDPVRQRAKPITLATYLIKNPRRIPHFYRFVANLPKVAEALALSIEATILKEF